MSTCDISVSARHIYNSEVPPSALGQASSPLLEGLSAKRVLSVPSIEGTGHKELIRRPLDDRVGKNGSGFFAPSSSTPFHKIGKNGFARFQRGLDGRIVDAVFSIGGQIDIVNGAEFDGLCGNTNTRHGLFGCSSFLVFISYLGFLPRCP